MNDLVVQLGLRTGKFETELKNAKTQIQNFSKGAKTAGDSVKGFTGALGLNVGSLAKFGTVAGAAVTVGKSLKTIIESNQITADAFHNTIDAAKTSVGNFASAIGRMDFTSFYDGLDKVWKKAKDLAEQLDQLADTQLGFDISTKRIQNEIQKQRNIINDKTGKYSEEDKKKAAEELKRLQAEQKTVSDTLIKDAYRAAKLQGIQGSTLALKDVSNEMIARVFDVETSPDRDKIKANVEKQYKAYQEEMKRLSHQWRYGEKSADGKQMSYREYESATSKLTNANKEIILTYNVLQTNDKKRKELHDNLLLALNSESAAIQAETSSTRALNKVEGERHSSGTGHLTEKKEEVIITGTLADYQKQLNEVQKKLTEELIQGTDEWNKWVNRAQILENRINNIKDSMKNVPLEKLSNGTIHQKALDYGLTKTDIRLPSSEDITQPEIEQTTIDSWDSFGQAMANTSTIISNLSNTFSESMELSTASVLNMVSQTLPAVSSLIGAIAALAGVEATQKAVQTSKHWIEAIAAVAALGSVVAAAISSAKKNAGKFANGGIVGGNSYTGDRLVANVNSGEMILNSTQQMKLWKQINSGTSGAGEVEFHISGTDLYGVLNNYNRKHNVIR